MKIAFPATGSDLSCMLDGRFGRSPRFVVVDSESGALEVLENAGNVEASQGAGIQSAQAVIAAGVQVLVCSHCGPKAFKVFQAAGTRILQAEPAALSDLLDKFRNGELPEMKGPDKAGHAG
jgi:predicted Fe-Mo cluster-binding NifX family protein